MLRSLAVASLFVCVALSSMSEAMAQRKGFIISFGAGIGLTSFTVTSRLGQLRGTSDRTNKPAVMTDFKIGHAPSDQVFIYWMSKVSWFDYSRIPDEKVLFVSGLGGLGVTYALKPSAPSLFVNSGLGFSTWSAPLAEFNDTWLGFGMVA